MARTFLFTVLLMLSLYDAESQTTIPSAEGTFCFTISTMQKYSECGYAPSQQESRILGGIGYIYGYFFSRHFLLEWYFGMEAGNDAFLGTISGNLAYCYYLGESSSALFAECGYGFGFPALFQNELLRLDVGIINIGGGIKLPIRDNHQLRVGLDYRRFRIYDNSTGSQFTTFTSLEFQIGYSLIIFSESED